MSYFALVAFIAIIASLEPEAAIHWLALPYESGQSTEAMEQADQERFLQLVDYAISETKARVGDHPGGHDDRTLP